MTSYLVNTLKNNYKIGMYVLTLVANVLPKRGLKDLKHRLHAELGKRRNLPLLKSDSWILLGQDTKNSR